MIDIDVNLKAKEAQKRFKHISKTLKDLTPIWKKFIPEYKNLVALEFESTKGKIMQGKRWNKLSDKYRVRKRKKYGNLPLLVITGFMREKAENFISKTGKHSLEMKVDGPDYFKYVHNKRAYFHTPKDDIPARAWRILIDIANNEVMKDVK